MTRKLDPGGIVLAAQGMDFPSWSYTNKIRESALIPSCKSIGHGLDNAMMELFWSSIQAELLDQK